jgi:hypothetical protein
LKGKEGNVVCKQKLYAALSDFAAPAFFAVAVAAAADVVAAFYSEFAM